MQSPTSNGALLLVRCAVTFTGATHVHASRLDSPMHVQRARLPTTPARATRMAMLLVLSLGSGTASLDTIDQALHGARTHAQAVLGREHNGGRRRALCPKIVAGPSRLKPWTALAIQRSVGRGRMDARISHSVSAQLPGSSALSCLAPARASQTEARHGPS